MRRLYFPPTEVSPAAALLDEKATLSRGWRPHVLIEVEGQLYEVECLAFDALCSMYRNDEQAYLAEVPALYVEKVDEAHILRAVGLLEDFQFQRMQPVTDLRQHYQQFPSAWWDLKNWRAIQ